MARGRKKKEAMSSDLSGDSSQGKEGEITSTTGPPSPPPTTCSIVPASDCALPQPSNTAQPQTVMYVADSSFLSLLKQVGAQGMASPHGELFTIKQMCFYLKEYIKLQSLYNPENPVEVRCSNDPLSVVFGVASFTLFQALELVKQNARAVPFPPPLPSRPSQIAAMQPALRQQHFLAQQPPSHHQQPMTPGHKQQFPTPPHHVVSQTDGLMHQRRSLTQPRSSEVVGIMQCSNISTKTETVASTLPFSSIESTSTQNCVQTIGPETMSKATFPSLERVESDSSTSCFQTSSEHLPFSQFSQNDNLLDKSSSIDSLSDRAFSYLSDTILHPSRCEDVKPLLDLPKPSTSTPIDSRPKGKSILKKARKSPITCEKVSSQVKIQSQGSDSEDENYFRSPSRMNKSPRRAEEISAGIGARESVRLSPIGTEEREHTTPVKQMQSWADIQVPETSLKQEVQKTGGAKRLISFKVKDENHNNEVADDEGVYDCEPSTSADTKVTAPEKTKTVPEKSKSERSTSQPTRRRQSSLSIVLNEPPKSVSQGSYPWYFRVDIEDLNDDDSEEEVLSVQSKSTVLVKDSSDDYWFLTDEDEEEDDNSYSDNPEDKKNEEQISVAMGENGISIEIQSGGSQGSNESDPPFSEEYELASETDQGMGQGEQEEGEEEDSVGEEVVELVLEAKPRAAYDLDIDFWADSESSEAESEASDEDLSTDKWTCEMCDTFNSPLQRYCERCWKVRPYWLPENAASRSRSRSRSRSPFKRSKRQLSPKRNLAKSRPDSKERRGRRRVIRNTTMPFTITSSQDMEEDLASSQEVGKEVQSSQESFVGQKHQNELDSEADGHDDFLPSSQSSVLRSGIENLEMVDRHVIGSSQKGSHLGLEKIESLPCSQKDIRLSQESQLDLHLSSSQDSHGEDLEENGIENVHIAKRQAEVLQSLEGSSLYYSVPSPFSNKVKPTLKRSDSNDTLPAEDINMNDFDNYLNDSFVENSQKASPPRALAGTSDSGVGLSMSSQEGMSSTYEQDPVTTTKSGTSSSQFDAKSNLGPGLIPEDGSIKSVLTRKDNIRLNTSPVKRSAPREMTNTPSKDLSKKPKLSSPSGKRGRKNSDTYNNQCQICFSKPKEASLIHGKTGHQVCCYTCAKKLRRHGKPCPVCRRPIQRVIKNFLV